VDLRGIDDTCGMASVTQWEAEAALLRLMERDRELHCRRHGPRPCGDGTAKFRPWIHHWGAFGGRSIICKKGGHYLRSAGSPCQRGTAVEDHEDLQKRETIGGGLSRRTSCY